MSFHHEMMLQRYGLGRPADMHSQVNRDPIFTPLFTAVFASVGLTGGALTFAAGLASAVTVTDLSTGVMKKP
jgi:hypothetical protein